MKYPKRSQYKHAKQKKYHVSNWAEYNEGLRRRGDLTVWFDEEAIANWKADKSGKPGGQRVYYANMKTSQAMRKAPPPFAAATRGNRQILPVPTAIPMAASRMPQRKLKRSCCSFIRGPNGSIF